MSRFPGAATDPLRISVRRATRADTDAVLAFTRETWDGWDYIADVWASWLEADDGVLLAAEVGEASTGHPRGRPIAVARLAMLSDTEAWMEGLRVDPAVRGRGVATAFQVAELAWAQAQGTSVVRYATGESNLASLRLGARHGFASVGRWRAFRPHADEASAARDAGGSVTREELIARLAREALIDRSAADPADVWHRLGTDPTFLGAGRLYEWRAWAWQELTEERLRRHAERGELLVFGDGAGWAAAVLAHERQPGGIRVALLGGDPDAAAGLVLAVAAASGDRPLLRLPEGSALLGELAERLERQGWALREHGLVLAERGLADEAGRPLPLPDEGHDRVEFAERPRRLDLVPAD